MYSIKHATNYDFDPPWTTDTSPISAPLALVYGSSRSISLLDYYLTCPTKAINVTVEAISIACRRYEQGHHTVVCNTTHLAHDVRPSQSHGKQHQ